VRKVRVLIVDDSAVVRRLLVDCLTRDAQIEVVGTAATGSIALAKIGLLSPDLVTLDVEMPGMSGLETLAEIRKAHARLPVIMFSAVTERGAATTLDALALGANDYVTKPASAGSPAVALQKVQDELIPKIKGLCARVVPGLAGALPAGRAAPPRPRRRLQLDAIEPARAELVAIGVSTGGPSALAKLVPALPAALPVPVVIVQHMPPLFTKLLAERLAAQSSIGVSEATAGEPLRPGHVWIAPGDRHLIVTPTGGGLRLELDQGPRENSCRPSVDVLFRSVAAALGPRALGVVLTGMGRDGLRGAECIHEAGGQVVVQDEESSVVWGMPGFVAHAGLADRGLALGEMAAEIVRRVGEEHSLGETHVDGAA